IDTGVVSHDEFPPAVAAGKLWVNDADEDTVRIFDTTTGDEIAHTLPGFGKLSAAGDFVAAHGTPTRVDIYKATTVSLYSTVTIDLSPSPDSSQVDVTLLSDSRLMVYVLASAW